MRNNGNFLEVDFFQKNKAGNSVCGDCFLSKKLRAERRVISVLSDGLGSGIKASVLSTMTASMALNFTAMGEDIISASTTIMNTLPQDAVRKISYSTFSLCDIDYLGNVWIVEYEAPSFYLYRKGVFVDIAKEKIPVERKDLDNTFLWISRFTLEREDRIIFISDGVSQSGIGTKNMPFGWEDDAKIYIADVIRQSPDISAKNLARKIVIQAEKNDNYSLKDDTTCSVVYMRNPRNLLVCTGPPYDEKNDKSLSNTVREFPGRKVICGGTTANIISRELQLPMKIDMHIVDKELPPISKIEGMDLVTEGILTLSKVENIFSGIATESTRGNGPAESMIKLLLDSDKITFLVGTRINIAHQDPNLPVELEIRRNVIKKIKSHLETKYLKDVEITYI